MTLETVKADYEDTVQRLIKQRDELRLQAHLFGMEAKEQWHITEQKWQHLKAKAKVVGAEAAHSGGEIKGALEDVMVEIDEAYQRIRRLF
jgi:NDP-sugar pyrophosphorylase family protein